MPENNLITRTHQGRFLTREQCVSTTAEVHELLRNILGEQRGYHAIRALSYAVRDNTVPMDFINAILGGVQITRNGINHNTIESLRVEINAVLPPEIVHCAHCEIELGERDDDRIHYTERDNGPYCYRCCDRQQDYENDEDNEDDYDGDRDDVGHMTEYDATLRFHALDANGVVTVTRYRPDENDHRLYMGFELETESDGNHLHEGGRMIVDDMAGHAYLHTDGSLNNGMEIVTHPGTLEYYMNGFPWQPITKLKRMGFTAWNSSTCGLHIHVSRSAFTSETHMWKFVYFIYKNRLKMIQFAGRESSRYAAFDLEKFLRSNDGWGGDNNVNRNELIDYVKGKKSNPERYCAVNMQNSGTIELRFFRPSLTVTTVQGCLQLCDAMYNYTKGITTQDVMKSGALEFDKFTAWAIEKSETYQDDIYKEMLKTITSRVETRTENQ